MKIVLLNIIFLPLFYFSQSNSVSDSISFYSLNNLTGMYLKNTEPQFNVTYNSDNNIIKKKLSFNTNTNYSFIYSSKINANELQQKTNLKYKNIFILHVFNHSIIRKIDTDNSIGFGFGKWWTYSSISYALLFQNTNYNTNIHSNILRHSVRLKLKYNTKRFNISYEYYYQPNVKSIKDNIIYGNIKMSLPINNRLNISLTDIVNYRSVSSIKLIHNITVGLGFNFKNN